MPVSQKQVIITTFETTSRWNVARFRSICKLVIQYSQISPLSRPHTRVLYLIIRMIAMKRSIMKDMTPILDSGHNLREIRACK